MAQMTDFEFVGTVQHAMSPWSSIECDDARAIVSYDGPYMFNGMSLIWIGEKVKNYFDSASYSLVDSIAFYRKHHLYISVKATGGTRTLLDFYIPAGQWRTDTQSVTCFCVYDGIGDSDELYIGDGSGFVWQFDTGYAANGSFTTKDFSAPNPFTEIVIHGVDVIQRSASSSPGTLVIEFRIDQTLNTSIVLTTATMTALYAISQKFTMGTEDYVKGSKIGLYVTPSATSKHLAIQVIRIWGEIAPITKALEV
jgi:hypothetical protein